MKGKIVFEAEEVEFFDTAEKVATRASGGKGSYVGKIYLPYSWVGKKVRCLLLEEPDTTDQ